MNFMGKLKLKAETLRGGKTFISYAVATLQYPPIPHGF